MGDLDDLARTAAAEKRRAEHAAAQHEREANQLTKRAQRRIARRAAGGGPAPTSLTDTLRFLALVLTGGAVAMTAALTLAIPTVPWAWLGGAAAAWAAAFAYCVWDARRWRARLPYTLDGFDWIAGEDPTEDDDDRAPWIALRVEIALRQPTADAVIHRAHVLEILAARVNTELTGERDVAPGDRKLWQVDPSAGVAAGETAVSMYTTRRLERWLRREVTTLARACPIERVTVHARYTGSSYAIPSSD